MFIFVCIVFGELLANNSYQHFFLFRYIQALAVIALGPVSDEVHFDNIFFGYFNITSGTILIPFILTSAPLMTSRSIRSRYPSEQWKNFGSSLLANCSYPNVHSDRSKWKCTYPTYFWNNILKINNYYIVIQWYFESLNSYLFMTMSSYPNSNYYVPVNNRKYILYLLPFLLFKYSKNE